MRCGQHGAQGLEVLAPRHLNAAPLVRRQLHGGQCRIRVAPVVDLDAFTEVHESGLPALAGIFLAKVVHLPAT